MRFTRTKFYRSVDPKKQFGGNLLKGKRKYRRPLSTKLPIHLVIRSNHKDSARALSFDSKNNRKLVAQAAKKFNIRIYQGVFNFTHLHLIVKIQNRRSYNGFIRVLCANLAKLAKLKSGKLFTLRPYTRIAEWGRGYKILLNYMKRNVLEAIGGLHFSPDDADHSLDSS